MIELKRMDTYLEYGHEDIIPWEIDVLQDVDSGNILDIVESKLANNSTILQFYEFTHFTHWHIHGVK